MANKPLLFGMIAAGLLGASIGGFAMAVFGPSLFPGRTTEAAVRETLRANPEIVLEALQAIQSNRAAALRVEQRAAVLANRAALLEDPDSVVLGNPQGDVTLVEFFDYRCPFCRETLKTVQALVAEDAELRVVLKEFPALGPESLIASQLAVAARKDARYKELHQALMTAPGPLDKETVLAIAADLGMDRAWLSEAMAAPDVERILTANHQLGRALMMEGTPAFIVGDVMLVGVVSLVEMKKLIADLRARGGDAALAKASG